MVYQTQYKLGFWSHTVYLVIHCTLNIMGGSQLILRMRAYNPVSSLNSYCMVFRTVAAVFKQVNTVSN